jgi:hypothetical protein
MRSVNRWHASRNRAALYALKVLSMRSTIEIVASIAGGSIRWPCRNRLLVSIETIVAGENGVRALLPYFFKCKLSRGPWSMNVLNNHRPIHRSCAMGHVTIYI